MDSQKLDIMNHPIQHPLGLLWILIELFLIKRINSCHKGSFYSWKCSCNCNLNFARFCLMGLCHFIDVKKIVNNQIWVPLISIFSEDSRYDLGPIISAFHKKLYSFKEEWWRFFFRLQRKFNKSNLMIKKKQRQTFDSSASTMSCSGLGLFRTSFLVPNERSF